MQRTPEEIYRANELMTPEERREAIEKGATESTRTLARRPQLEGQDLLNYVAAMVTRRYSTSTIARKAGIPYEHARQLREDVWNNVFRGIESDYGPEGLKRLKHEITEDLREGMDDLKQAMRYNRRAAFETKKLNTKPVNQMAGLSKQISMMHGLLAPTQTINTDLRLYATVQPEDMQRVLDDPDARQAMLAFEEAVSRINSEQHATIDVTPSPSSSISRDIAPWEDAG